MLGLGHEVGGNPRWFAVFACDDYFGWPGEHVNGAVEGHKLFRSGDIGVAWADNLVDRRDALCSISKSGDGLCAADAIELGNAEHRRRSERLRGRPRRGDDNALDTRDLRGNHRHEQRRGQRIASAGDVTADRIDRPHTLTNGDTARWSEVPVFWTLAHGECPDVASGDLECALELGRDGVRGLRHLAK